MHYVSDTVIIILIISGVTGKHIFGHDWLTFDRKRNWIRSVFAAVSSGGGGGCLGGLACTCGQRDNKRSCHSLRGVIRVVRIVLMVPYLAALTVAVRSLTRGRHRAGADVGGRGSDGVGGGRRPTVR